MVSFLVWWWITSAQESALDPMNLPVATNYVSDFSNVLSADQLHELNTLAQEYENKTSHQLFVALFPHRNGYELFDIGMKIFGDNRIGQKGKDNGLLLVIATEEKKIRIIVGYGLEWAYPDVLASRTIEDLVRPAVNSGDVYTAVKNYYERSMQIIDSDEWLQYASSNIDNLDEDSFQIFFMVGFFLFYVASLVFSGSGKWFEKNSFFGHLGVLWTILLIGILFAILAGAFVALVGYIVGAFLSVMPKWTGTGSGWRSSWWGWGWSSWWGGFWWWGWWFSGGWGAWD